MTSREALLPPGCIECDYCNQLYDPTSCRWQCPRCKLKTTCCEGSPLPAQTPEAICTECGNDLATEGYTLCSECLEATS